MSKCFCHFNGYEVKDAKARQQIEDNKNDLQEQIDTNRSIIQEQNNNADLKVWVGSQEDYNSISDSDKINNCMYITTGTNVLYTTDSTGLAHGETIEIPNIDKYSLFAIKVRSSLGECMIFTGLCTHIDDSKILAGIGYSGDTNNTYYRVDCEILGTELTVNVCTLTTDISTFEGNSGAYISEIIGII